MTMPELTNPESSEPEPGYGVMPSIDRVQLSGPPEIVQVIPYLVGFEPSDSLVLVAMGPPRNHVIVTVRADLGDPLDAVVPWFEAASTKGADTFVALVYDAEVCERAPITSLSHTSLAHRDRIDQLEETGESYDMSLMDALAVDGQRWWSYLCQRSTCCPPEGTPIVRNGAIAAAAVSSGMVVQPDREALAQEISADVSRQTAVSDAMQALSDQEFAAWSVAPGAGSQRTNRRRGVHAIEASLQRYLDRAGPVDPHDAAVALLSLRDVLVRDAMMASTPAAPGEPVESFWADLCRCAPDELVAPPATLYALCVYAHGDGARANIALERALESDPTYRFAQLLSHAVCGGMDPHDIVPQIVAGAVKERAKLLRRARRSRRR